MSLNKPMVLYRHDTDEHLLQFTSSFRENFEIISCVDDELALQIVSEQPNLCALIIEQNDFSTRHTSSLYTRLAKQSEKYGTTALPIFVLAQDVQIDDVASVLKSHNIKKFYSKPYDKERIASDIFSAHLSRVNRSRKSEPSSFADFNTHNYQKPGVLIVDDEVLATKYLVKQLMRANSEIEVFVAANADEALELLKIIENNIAVIISDHRMPGMKGEQLLNEIRQLHPNVIRILTSAYQEVDVALGAINNGQIYQYLKKPWDAHHVNQLIVEALDQYKLQANRLEAEQSESTKELVKLLERRSRNFFTRLQTITNSIDLNVVLPAFWEFLQSIKSSSAKLSYQAAIRASKETDLEDRLLTEFVLRVNRWIKILSDIQEKVTFSLEQNVDEDYEFIILLDEIIVSVIDELHGGSRIDPQETAYKHYSEDIRELQTKLADQVVLAIRQLLKSSNLSTSIFRVKSNKAYSTELVSDPSQALVIFKHFLSPLTSISNSFIEQQSALLLLFTLDKLSRNQVHLKKISSGLQLILRAGVTER